MGFRSGEEVVAECFDAPGSLRGITTIGLHRCEADD